MADQSERSEVAHDAFSICRRRGSGGAAIGAMMFLDALRLGPPRPKYATIRGIVTTRFELLLVERGQKNPISPHARRRRRPRHRDVPEHAFGRAEFHRGSCPDGYASSIRAAKLRPGVGRS